MLLDTWLNHVRKVQLYESILHVLLPSGLYTQIMSRGTGERSLTPKERQRLEAIRSTRTLGELAELTGARSEHRAYFEAKTDWYNLREKELAPAEESDELAGDCVTVDGHDFHVHGVTHTGTDEERAFLRRHASNFLDEGATIYCEQGIRPMYFDDFGGVCEIDDYKWSMAQCKGLGLETCVADASVESLSDNLESVSSKLRKATFSLIESGGRVYGEGFADALGDVASIFLTSHEDASTGEDFESFRRGREASKNPERLGELQRYYKKKFLPQPLEREWLRNHDRELEMFTHARNERIADYAVYHNEDDTDVRIITGAAHQPGVIYYLEAHRDGERTVDEFELFG